MFGVPTGPERAEISREYWSLAEPLRKLLGDDARAETFRRRTLLDPTVAAVVEESRAAARQDVTMAIVPVAPAGNEMVLAALSSSDALAKQRESLTLALRSQQRSE